MVKNDKKPLRRTYGELFLNGKTALVADSVKTGGIISLMEK